MTTDDTPRLRDEIIDAFEDEEAHLKFKIESLGARLWLRLVALTRSLRSVQKFRRHRPF
jgi:hypothetical protein